MLTIGIYGIPDITHNGGKPTYTHDHSVVVMKNGKVQDAIQLERYTGIKHDNSLPSHVLTLINKHMNSGEEIRLISVNSFLGSSFISSDGNLRIEPKSDLKVEDILAPARCGYYFDGMNRKIVKAFIMSHEFAHISSALPFVGRFRENSLLVHIDGGAYDSCASVWHYNGGNIKCLNYSWTDLKDVTNNFNVNPLSCFLLRHRPVDHLAVPGKLMGYSAYGEAKPEIMDWLRKNRFFMNFKGNEEEMLGIINQYFRSSFNTFDTLNPFFMDVAACIQKDFQEKILAYFKKWAEKTGAEYLYYAGGAALNIITNSLLEESGMFKEIFIPPPASDCGLALGAAAYLEYLDHGKIEVHPPFLNTIGVPDYPDSCEFDVDEVANYLQEGKIIGVCMGAGEIGPRALGHRSILARADDVELRKKLSEGIKKREWYRPVAPIIGDFVASEIFTKDPCKSNLVLYMLGQYTVKDEYRQALGGVVHIDGSVRVQVIRKDDKENSFLYSLLKVMYERFGTLGLINTSFNVKGKPIFHFTGEACYTAMEMGLDGMIVNNLFYKFEGDGTGKQKSHDLLKTGFFDAP